MNTSTHSRRRNRSTHTTPRGDLRAALLLAAAAVAPALVPTPARADLITWIGASGTWTDGVTTNWNPADEPDTNDFVFVEDPITLTLGSNNTVNGLDFSNSAKLNTNDFDLTIGGNATFSGGVTGLTITANSAVNTHDLIIGEFAGSDAFLNIKGGTLTCVAPTLVGQLTNFGAVAGHGTINLTQAPGAAFTILNNEGSITATTVFPGDVIFGAQPAGTLHIHTISSNAHLDLDGSSNTGVLNVQQNQTLRIDGTLTNAFAGTINLRHNSTLNFQTTAWALGDGDIIVDNGAVGGFPFGTPADVAYIAGQTLTAGNSSTITVQDTDGTLEFDAPLTMNSGSTLTNHGKVVFDNTTNINTGASVVNNGLVVFSATTTVGFSAVFTNPQSDSSMTVDPGVTVNINQGNFNADGSDTSTNVITIGSAASLNLSLDAPADQSLSGTMNLSAGTLSVVTNDNSWSIDGWVNALTGTSHIDGETVTFTSAALAVSAGANLAVDADAVLAGNSSSYTGAGTLTLNGATVTYSGSNTITVATLDWDGTTGGSSHTLNSGATLNINSATILDEVDDDITVSGNAALNVNGNAGTWTMRQSLATNPTDTGVATIGGTSRMILSTATGILNAIGDTTINAPVTFGSGTDVNVSAAAVLTLNNDAVYSGLDIGGAGNFLPSNVANTVTATTSITTGSFDFDRGPWTLNPGVTLLVNVNDYNSSDAFKLFGNTLNVNGATLSVISGEPEFTVNDELNLTFAGGLGASYTGDPIDIGNDLGPANAELNVSGPGVSTIDVGIDFNGDAAVNVAPGSTLVLTAGVALFETVNATGNASFTGSGTFMIESEAKFQEAATFNMPGGTVSFDGRASDFNGNLIEVNAPVTINAATFDSFGKTTFGSTQQLWVDNTTGFGTGTLTVNLDNPAAKWTLNSTGLLQLLNENTTPSTLLFGNDIQVNGRLNVIGAARTDARLDIGASSIVDLQIANQPFYLSAGNTTNNPNTIAGALVQGPGILAADSGSALHGFGTINTNIDFDGASNLRADNGTLTLGGTLLDVGIVGTNDADGTLHLVNPQTLSAMTMELLGGNVTGAAITNQSLIRGNGTIANNVSNPVSGTIQGVAGGNLKFTGTIGTSSGTVDLNSGGVEFNNNIINGASGLITGPGTLRANANLTNNGLLRAPAGVTTVFGAVTNNGTLSIQTNADATFDTNVTVNAGGAATAATGSLTKIFGTLTVSGSVSFNSNIVGASLANLVINAGGTVDLTNNRLLINYAGASPANNIRQYILQDRLFSSVADPNNILTIGYVENSLMGLGTWSNLPADTTSLLLRPTYIGDANLDGKVNADDFALIDKGFALGLTGWAFGDFNHSGTITPADYMEIDRVFALQGPPLSPAFLAARAQQFGPEYVSALVASIPEPSSLAACGLALPMLTRRRRSSR